ncbi:MAG: ImmA/IrrE family metallo-endopeptidase [Clostridiales bacterium]|jgi:Zn-dependent peptidase ImmA (M78 family)|nr:ImmA/IrrE family metallo-endopeptidase [Clostridiales bacterium]
MEYVYDKTALVPVNVTRDNYDEVAADFLTHYGCAQYLTTPMPVPIFDIARKRMNLTVYTNQQLSENCDILGTIAFFGGDVEVYDAGTSSYISFGVRPNTVLIDSAIDNEGRKNNTMAHECVHYHIHRFYFASLRKKVADADIAFRCPVRISDGDESTRDEERMEKQARGIAPRILMPKEATKKKLREIFASRIIDKKAPNWIVVLTEIVDELAAFFHVSKVSAKYRMVDLGFMSNEEADEIYNFDTNTAAFDFAERPLTVKTSSRPLTRHVSLEHAFYEFSKNDGFREMLQSGMFRFVEDAFVINDPKYVRQDENGKFRLTPYAVKHPQECTLLFEYAVSVAADPGKFPATVLGYLTRVETDYKKLPRYYPNVQNDTVFDNAKAKEQAQQKAFENIRDEFGQYMTSRQAIAPATTFWERVEQIRQAKSFSKNKFKTLSGLDDQTVSRLGKGDKVTMRNGIAACFGLDLDATEAKELLSLAQLALGKDKESLAYEYVLSTFQGCSLDERNDVLHTLGIGSIGVRSKDEIATGG